MAFSKSSLFDPKDQITSAYAEIMSHPARLDIIRTLSEIEAVNVHTFTRKYPLSKSTISQHLESLREAQLVTFVEEYPYVKYSLNRSSLEKMAESVLGYYKDLSAILISMEEGEALFTQLHRMETAKI